MPRPEQPVADCDAGDRAEALRSQPRRGARQALEHCQLPPGAPHHQLVGTVVVEVAEADGRGEDAARKVELQPLPEDAGTRTSRLLGVRLRDLSRLVVELQRQTRGLWAPTACRGGAAAARQLRRGPEHTRGGAPSLAEGAWWLCWGQYLL